MMENAADDFAAIAARLREIAADRDEAQMQRADEPPTDREYVEARFANAAAAWRDRRFTIVTGDWWL